MSAFDTLSPPIKKFIWDKKWPSLRPIQNASIDQYVKTDKNLVISAPTAGGKTEAAFLPAMSGVKDWEDGVKIIYISPLIALINDQFQRINSLSKYLDVPITSWHGEAAQSAKNKLLKKPSGILMITPESIEAMLVRRPSEAKLLFSGVETVIVDEIHSFMGTSRGSHLQSLLVRTAQLAKNTPRYIGLSATIAPDSYADVKRFFKSPRETVILLDRGINKRKIEIIYVQGEEGVTTLPANLVDELYGRTLRDRMLVFPNARTRVEELTVGLQRRAKFTYSGLRYFAHHGSVDKELRLQAETFAKTTDHDLFTICCTSTLELGIDIGAVDSIAQIEAPHSVAMLAQRLGRSGRRGNEARLTQYATDSWSLLQALAAISLLEEGKLENVEKLGKQYSMLFQQLLSILLQSSGMTHDDLVVAVKNLPFSYDISTKEIKSLIKYMIKENYIEQADETLIVGLEAERIVTSRGFYAHFQDNTDFTVLADTKKVGELPLKPDLVLGVNIFLAGRIWQVKEIDTKTRKIFVKKAKDGKPPKFSGTGPGGISSLLRERMHGILTQEYALPEAAKGEVSIIKVLEDLRQRTGIRQGDSCLKRRIINEKLLHTFAGSKINYTLHLMLRMRGNEDVKIDDSWPSTVENPNLKSALNSLINKPVGKDELRSYLLENYDKRPPNSTKYLQYLPDNFVVDEIMSQYFDAKATNKWLERIDI